MWLQPVSFSTNTKGKLLVWREVLQVEVKRGYFMHGDLQGKYMGDPLKRCRSKNNHTQKLGLGKADSAEQGELSVYQQSNPPCGVMRSGSS